MSYEAEISASLQYLISDAAHLAMKRDPYWPKWDGPWWHMLLLFEMGEVKTIPEGIVGELVRSLNKAPLKIFPFGPQDFPAEVDYYDTQCHCQLGCVYQVLAAWGLDVDQELPWIRPWFLRYQMADGGLTCDNEAYLVKDEVPSSMVGTIAVFEAVLLYTSRPWTKEETAFLDRGAQFLMGRKLVLGSDTKHNAAERISAEKWLQPCFPRFYFYDTLRGLLALLRWADKTGKPVPPASIADAVKNFTARFVDDHVCIERQAFAGILTADKTPSGTWLRKQPAGVSSLLREVSRIGDVSPFLTEQWHEAKHLIASDAALKGLLG